MLSDVPAMATLLMFLVSGSLLRKMLLRMGAEEPHGIFSHFILNLCLAIYGNHVWAVVCLFHMAVGFTRNRGLEAVELVVREEL